VLALNKDHSLLALILFLSIHLEDDALDSIIITDIYFKAILMVLTCVSAKEVTPPLSPSNMIKILFFLNKTSLNFGANHK